MKSPFEIDAIVGMEEFVTDTKGIGGELRQRSEDFFVEEVWKDSGEVGDGGYTHFTMEKKGWDTNRAIRELARRLRVSRKRFGFAGTKDKKAVTRQRVAVWKVGREELEKVRIRDIALSDFRCSDQRVNLGDLEGNRFRIAVRDIELEGQELEETVRRTKEELEDRGVPNYFGYQRFGVIRPNTHEVGKRLVLGDLEGAVFAYLCNPTEREREDAYLARKGLEDTRDIAQALKDYPKRLDYERSMLDALSKNSNDYAGALRRLPKKLRWMLVHAYQSYLFNLILSRLIGQGVPIREKELPLFGHESGFSAGGQGDIEREILEAEGITFDNFEIPSMPELTVKGELRRAWIETALEFEVEEDELSPGRRRCDFSFMLPKGSYATVLLREFMKVEPTSY